MLKAPLFAISVCGLLLAADAPAQNAAAATVKPPALTFVFEEMVTLADRISVGDTPAGNRGIVPITGGTFSGAAIKGKVLPGGWDWQLADRGGCFHLKADYMIKTDDGVIINVLNTGTWCKDSSVKSTPQYTSPVFEAPKGRYDWLNGGAWVSTVEVTNVDAKPAVRIRFYRAE